MDTHKPTTVESNRAFQWPSSIQQRLPLLICILLLIVVSTFGWLSYNGIKNAAEENGKLRLQSLSGQLSTLFGQSAQTLISTTRASANHESFSRFILSGGKDSVEEVKSLAHLLQADSTWIKLEITDAKGITIPIPGANTITAPVPAVQTIGINKPRPDTGKVGNIYVRGDSMYYPIVAAIVDRNTVVGYLVRWRLMRTTPQAVSRFTMLLGEGVSLYVGNVDGSLWTDMNKPIPGLPKKAGVFATQDQHTRDGSLYYAATSPVPNTRWTVMTELSEQMVTKPASNFLKTAIRIGLIVVVLGILLTWLVSRSITRPLKKLTSAAAAIAGGDYSEKVSIRRKDEIGLLARSFNIMVNEVQHAHKSLESKVQQRTAQLEDTNKELEAFSYSVSHDLRAPLRAISGYAMILKEDHSPQLDTEANRILGAIISNASMMGKLIDDLISFSRINKRETLYHQVDMKIMAELCFRELQQQEKSHCKLEIDNLPPCYGDGSLLKQVWINLLSNAIKYSAKNPDPIIQIGFRQEGEKIIYIVRDNGAGFDMKYAGKLFGVFQRLHNYEEYQGTGIGLALVKRILNKQGGDIWAEAELGKGACFYFSMPVKVEEPAIEPIGTPQNIYHE
jgi:signal transduction histidine kinase